MYYKSTYYSYYTNWQRLSAKQLALSELSAERGHTSVHQVELLRNPFPVPRQQKHLDALLPRNVIMESTDNKSHEQLVEKLVTGFEALLEQVQELALRNTDLEQRLARVRVEVITSYLLCIQESSYDDTP